MSVLKNVVTGSDLESKSTRLAHAKYPRMNRFRPPVLEGKPPARAGGPATAVEALAGEAWLTTAR